MERIAKNVLIVSGIFIAAGLIYVSGRQDPPAPKTEQDMIALLPDQVANMTYHRDPEHPGMSYKMPDDSYKILKPFGIVPRKYWKGERTYEVVVIASRSKDSFHDPRVCFSAQGWTIESFRDAFVTTKRAGKVPVTLMTITQEKGEPQLAAFLYKSPEGEFYSNTRKFKVGMWWDRVMALMTGKFRQSESEMDGVFYRFMPENKGMTPEQREVDLKWFIGQYLDEVQHTSNGYF